MALSHQLPNFAECWWDKWILDVLLCNGLGMWLGLKAVKWAQGKEYNWMGISQISSRKGRVKRALGQMLPYDVEEYEWKALSSPRCASTSTIILHFDQNVRRQYPAQVTGTSLNFPPAVI